MRELTKIFKLKKLKKVKKNDCEKQTVAINSFYKKIPASVRRDMKASGMFSNVSDRKDDYVDPNVLSVVLDRSYYNESVHSFILMLNYAIKKRYDKDVLGVIKDFYEVENVIKVILDSRVPEYVSEIINMPLDLCKKMLNGENDVDNKINVFIQNEINNSSYLQYVVDKYGSKYLDSYKKLDEESQQKAIALSNNREEVLKLLESGIVCYVAQRIIAKTRDLEYLSKLLEIKFLCNDAQRAILNTGNLELIFKLFKRADLTDSICNSLVFQLFCCRVKMSTEQQKAIVKTGNREYILKLLDRQSLSWTVQKMIVKTNDREYILKLLKSSFHLFERVQLMIADLDVLEYKIMLLERDDLYNKVRQKIIGVNNQDFVLGLLQKK